MIYIYVHFSDLKMGVTASNNTIKMISSEFDGKK